MVFYLSCLCSDIFRGLPMKLIVSDREEFSYTPNFSCLVPKIQGIYGFNYCTTNGSYPNPNIGSFCKYMSRCTLPLFILDGTLFWLCFRVIFFCLLFLVFDSNRDPTIPTEKPMCRFPFASWKV